MREMAPIVIKTCTGFEQDCGQMRHKYDADGKYLGQYQPDMLSEDPTAGEIFLNTYPGDPCYHELTPEQMALASK
jgi:hypothetical protein